ncbi:gluconate 2-dehydrogenase subunit 3 family protein [Bowmanella dokdonensis]|uniref:Gluconate 2-dehydrogenase subunit 3 family protein n=1 Tax=Bowmanella dokdonensis TaxID=751969 RepID=A0A939DK96_9ALTE|nr:gluconate 2-dehydrogenase subunit 3 family protein [Bowmanella dokdonensis]MBN7823720.1 gluconate 2-dehydrogenase subunit 3 family protein [Bowmanella dokdonensis]
MTEQQHSHHYQSGMTRRESLKWLGLLVASSTVSMVSGCGDWTHTAQSGAGHWPDLKLAPITARGYGQDPNLLIPPESPWPKTLTAAQLELVAILSDIIVPREGSVPSASQVHVPDVIDEWVSAPYSVQQQDRVTLLHALAWIDDEATLRFNANFAALDPQQQLAIVDDIAYDNEHTAEPFRQIAGAFGRLRSLVLAAFFCSPVGTRDIGYMGNVPIAGDYPGPSDEARAHLEEVLADLGLSDCAYSG